MISSIFMKKKPSTKNMLSAIDVFTGLFSDRTLTDRTLGQTVVVVRCDIPQAPMLKHPIKRCHLKKGILHTDRSCPSPSGSEIPAPHSATVFSSSLVHRRHRLAPPLTALPSPRRHCCATAIAAISATMEKALPRRQLTGCIHLTEDRQCLPHSGNGGSNGGSAAMAVRRFHRYRRHQGCQMTRRS